MASEPLEAKPRVAIIIAAMHLFGKQGFTGTSMRDIATAVGLLPGSLYAHIDSKEALLLEIVKEGISCFITAVEPQAKAALGPVDRLRQMIIAHVEVVAENPERSQVVFHQWRFLGEDNLPQAVERRREYESLYVTAVEEGVRAGAFRADLNLKFAVLTILGSLNWTPQWFSPDGSLSPAQIGDLMADALLGGILA